MRSDTKEMGSEFFDLTRKIGDVINDYYDEKNVNFDEITNVLIPAIASQGALIINSVKCKEDTKKNEVEQFKVELKKLLFKLIEDMLLLTDINNESLYIK